MNTSQIKMTIFFIKLVDWLLILAVLGVGIPAVFYSDRRFIAAVGILVGIGLINIFGNWSYYKVAILKYDLERQEQKSTL